MAERVDNLPSTPTSGRRSAETIKREIDMEKEIIFETVNRIGDKLHRKMNWRSYVMQYPIFSLAAAAGVGFVMSGALARRGSYRQELAHTVGNRSSTGPIQESPIKLLLVGLLTKAVTSWIESSAFASKSGGNSGQKQTQLMEETQHSQQDYQEDRMLS